MPYTALYRKYRPSTFQDVIGQDPIVTTLTNQISAGRISHAYLFAGSRGTGKTSCAKIFARAVNCEKPKSGSACGKCKTCIALSDPSNIDILEIDAASNNKVDEAREIRERVKYLPASGKYKVYIIDEVHMLTDSAYNALLKTLEEPPAHVLFILATTEAHKLPQTILSRCMRFDFRLVAQPSLSKWLKKVYKKENKEFEDEAVELIASAAEGSVRDLLSIADLCLHYSDKKLTYADTLKILGLADKNKIASFFENLYHGDIKAILNGIEDFFSGGKSFSLLAKNVASYARDLLALKTGADALVVGTKENLTVMKKAAENISSEFLLLSLTEFSKIDTELRYSISPRIVFETTAVRLSKLTGDNIEAVIERVKRLEEGIIPEAPRRGGTLPPNNNITPQENESIPLSLPVQSIADAVQSTKISDAKTIFGKMVTFLRKQGNMGLFALFSEQKEFFVENNEFVIMASEDTYLRFLDTDTINMLEKGLKEMGAVSHKVRVDKKPTGVDMDKEILRVRKMTGLEPKIIK